MLMWFTPRWIALALALIAVGFAGPCLAEYRLLWGGGMGVSFCNGTSCTVPWPLADWDNDGRIELATVEGWPQRTVKIVDVMTGEVEGEVAITPVGLAMHIISRDLNNDGVPEIIAFGEGSPGDGALFVITFVGPTANSPDMPTTLAGSGAAVRPNPFNPSATIDYSLAIKGNVTLRAYDTAGRLVRTLVDGPVEAGSYSIHWDGRDNAGHVLPSGTYFYSLSLDGQVLDKGKAVILK